MQTQLTAWQICKMSTLHVPFVYYHHCRQYVVNTIVSSVYVILPVSPMFVCSSVPLPFTAAYVPYEVYNNIFLIMHDPLCAQTVITVKIYI